MLPTGWYIMMEDDKSHWLTSPELSLTSNMIRVPAACISLVGVVSL